MTDPAAPVLSDLWTALSVLGLVVRVLVASAYLCSTAATALVVFALWPERVRLARDALRRGAFGPFFAGLATATVLVGATLILSIAVGPLALVIAGGAALWGGGIGFAAVVEHGGALLPLPERWRRRGPRLLAGAMLVGGIPAAFCLMGGWALVLGCGFAAVVALCALGLSVLTVQGTR